MDFKHINDRNKTPKSEISIFSKRISATVYDSPFRNLPNFSTPPSRFSKIINPFESHLLEKLHLPTFSPSVFAEVSTPKSEEKFKWTIDDISSLKPADIDETTVSQHFSVEDPHVESLVQQKIDTFFSKAVIVPSPMNTSARPVPLITQSAENSPKPKQYSEGAAQTVLTLPPQLPQHIEDILKPFFTYTEDQQQSEIDITKQNSLYYNLLFNLENNPESHGSVTSSPALSTGLSPIQFSPIGELKNLDNSCNIPELKECNLSPISGKSPNRSTRFSRSVSACRLNFSARMSIDASMVVPDMDNQMSSQSVYQSNDDSFSAVVQNEMSGDSIVNWDMEYKQISRTSPSNSSGSEKMDISNSNTPHSKIFTSQRKRLSDSFKDEEEDFNQDNEPQIMEDITQNKMKIFRNDDVTDAGYDTESVTTIGEDSHWSIHVFASTPSKRKN